MTVAVTMTLAEHVVRVARGGVPEAAMVAARRSLLDGVGVMMAATGLEPAALPFGDLALAMGGTSEASLLGRRGKLPAAGAAFANGALAHAIDFGDGHPETLVHPHGAVVPASLALAERENANGAALATAIAVGADIAVRCAHGLGPDRGGSAIYRPALVGAIGAAASAGVLLKLEPTQIAAAWSLVLCEIGTSAAIKRGPLRGMRDGFSAKSGVVAALLVAQGVTGTCDAIEGKDGFLAMFASATRDDAAMLAGLGERFLGAEVAYKPWPTCGGAHPHIAAALELRAELSSPQMIKAVEARVSPLFFDMLWAAPGRVPGSAIEAKFDLAHCLAVALEQGHVALDDFTPRVITKPAIRAMAARVHAVRDASLGPLAGVVTIETRDGARLTRRIDHVPGGPQRPMSDAALIDKFADCVAHAAAPPERATVEAVAHTILMLDAQTHGAAFIARLNNRL